MEDEDRGLMMEMMRDGFGGGMKMDRIGSTGCGASWLLDARIKQVRLILLWASPNGSRL